LGERLTHGRERASDFFYLCCWTQNWKRERGKIWERLGEKLREFWERNEMYNWRNGLGSFYSEMNGQDCSKTTASNDWGEDLVLNIKFSEIRCMNLFSAESWSIHFYVDWSTWTVGRSICFLHYKIIDRSIILSQIFIRFSTYN
jgi:hypothetical protein